MKQYIENLITDALTTIYEQKGVIDPIIIKPSVEWNEITKVLYIKTSLPTYRMVVLKRLIYNYEIPVSNIIVGNPEC